MGWWGFNVMEGDPPMDAEGDILDLLSDIHAERTDGDKLDPFDDNDAVANAAQVQLIQLLNEDGVASDVLARIKAADDIWETGIAIQVLGEIIMCNSFKMPDDVRVAAIQAAKDDDWAGSNKDRKKAMKAYIKRAEEYNGVAVEPVSRGLFDVIGEHIAAGEKGLVNKR